MIKPLPPALWTLAREQSGALLGSQIADHLGERRLLSLVREGGLNRLWYNTFVVPELSSPTVAPLFEAHGFRNAEQHRIGAGTRLAAAALSLRRPVVACLDTAAELHGFDVARDPDTHILAVQDWPSHRHGLVHHRPELLRPLQRVAGQAVTDLTETALRIAARQPHPAKSLAVLDAAVRHTGATSADLLLLAARMSIRGVRLMRRLVPLTDPGAASPGESWLRWVCLDAGFPTPTTQIPVRTPVGEFWVDLGWPEQKVGCEYDGIEFHTGAALTRDRQRYNALAGAGWLMLGVTGHMVWNERPRLVEDIARFLDLRRSASA